ncbi:MAG: excinuclease ABC subunit UvrA [Fibrobacterales bacterium]
MSDTLIVRNAEEHNLKKVSVEIPRDSIVVVTGVSGSGKSSLAFDTIFQEGQKKYLDSLSAYARQYIGDIKSPKVETIKGISPTISIDQKTINRNPRSTVGTITELFDHYRILYARLGTPHCPGCGDVIAAQSVEQVADGLMAEYLDSKIMILSPIVMDRKGEYRKELQELVEWGFTRARIDGTIHRLDEEIQLKRYEKHTIEIVIDRLTIEKKALPRIREAIETALKFSDNLISFLIDDTTHMTQGTKLACAKCHISIKELEPRLFSFNATQGACPTCNGIGVQRTFDIDLIIPDTNLSIPDGAIKLITQNGNVMFSKFGLQEIEILGKEYGFSIDTPWKDFTKAQKKIILYGSTKEITFSLSRKSKRGFKTIREHRRIRGVMEVVQRVWDRWHVSLMHKYMHSITCPDCNGKRLNSVALAVTFHTQTIDRLSSLTIHESMRFFQELILSEKELHIGNEIFKEISSRLEYLDKVGLGYLNINRSAATLSGGEAQRIRLASQVGAGLQGVLYILDEPSIGLHPRDNVKLLETLKQLKNQGNSLIIVEHDEETMRIADTILDIGPGAGVQGGTILASGDYKKLVETKESLTGQYLSGKRRIEIPEYRRIPGDYWITIKGAASNNLQNIDVAIPLGLLTCITGVSGSGKSTLIHEVLRKGIGLHFGTIQENPGKCKSIDGLEHIAKVVEIDQSPIGRTPRSNPATYTKMFDLIRDLFAKTPEAKIRGYSKSRFSFNVAGGRCEVCEGSGIQEYEMQILENVKVPCDECSGSRYNHNSLEIYYKGKNIADVLNLTVEEALTFFENQPKIHAILTLLKKVDLGYITLGQSSTTLSGGEAQRIKITSELKRSTQADTLYILDEPTTGLHFEDIKQLMICFQELIDRGNSMIIIEHNTDVIKCADWIIDLGPEGGSGGGTVVATGTPEEVAESKHSYTAPFLKSALTPRFTTPKSLKKSKKSPTTHIEIKGAKKHNLKNIDISIPQHKLTVVTGVSGSGKSSLAFHTLFAEGQRRFVESMSTYARRFVGQMDRGSVDSITGLAPAIAIDQKSANKSPRSTVATITEIYDYFRILYARIGTIGCIHCGNTLEEYSLVDIYKKIEKRDEGSPIAIAAPIKIPGTTKRLLLDYTKNGSGLIQKLIHAGVVKLNVNGKTYSVEEAPDITKECTVYAIIDRVKALPKNRKRIIESLERARELGNNLIALPKEDGTVDLFSTLPGCTDCHYYFEDQLEPKHFSFNSHWGACEFCSGLGTINNKQCPMCEGDRLKVEYLAVTFNNSHITDLSRLTIDECFALFQTYRFAPKEKIIVRQVIQEIENRLTFLRKVGIGYLSLDRKGDTLSGGESQRIRLASQIGSGLEGALYVLDEPTTGLHQKDTQVLIATLKELRDLGNTVVVVEHDTEFMLAADHIIDMGPAAGEYGGEVLVTGSPAALKRHTTKSLTAAYLHNKKMFENPIGNNAPQSDSVLTLKGSALHNLKGDTLTIPFKKLTAISGVSGSGKSSLIIDCLHTLLENKVNKRRHKVKDLGRLTYKESIDKIVLVDQSPIGGTPRSTPITYTKAFDKIRDLYAALPDSKIKGYLKGRFSFNKAEGRCPVCEGRGSIHIEMHFLSDVWEVCDGCKGKRYNSDTLSITFKGKTIADVMEMRVDEATSFFSNHPSVHAILKTFSEIGLGYLRLGQSATTLSGGESQRLKLAAELSKAGRGHTVFILDEPSTGLHSHDIQQLWNILRALVDKGNTVIVIEHQVDIIRNADWLIDIGPEGGGKGGSILFTGTQDDFKSDQTLNHTHKALYP